MGRKNKGRRKKKSSNVGPSLADKLSGIKLPSASKPSSPHESAPSKPVRQASGSDEDIDFAEAMGGTTRVDEDENEWLQWANQEVNQLPTNSQKQTKSSTSSSPSTLPSSKQPDPLEKEVESLRLELDALREKQSHWDVQAASLQREKECLQQEVQATSKENTALKAEKKKLLQQLEAEATRSSQTEPKQEQSTDKTEAPVQSGLISLRQALQDSKVPEGREVEAFSLLAEAGGRALLPHLYVEGSSTQGVVERHLVLCCQHPECQEAVAASSGKGLLLVDDPSKCEFCEGSDNRRAVRRMIRACRTHRRYRVALVGGSPDAHAELNRLVPSNFDLKLVSGKVRRDKQQATDDLRFSDLVVIWGPTILPHKISELYTKQKDAFPNKLHVVHTRGVASMARDVVDFLESIA